MDDLLPFACYEGCEDLLSRLCHGSHLYFAQKQACSKLMHHLKINEFFYQFLQPAIAWKSSAPTTNTTNNQRRTGYKFKNEKQQRLSIIVIGAGLKGILCALYLQYLGHSVRILEASEMVGGEHDRNTNYTENDVNSLHLIHPYRNFMLRMLDQKTINPLSKLFHIFADILRPYHFLNEKALPLIPYSMTNYSSDNISPKERKISQSIHVCTVYLYNI